MSWKRAVYKTLAISNDTNAVKRGKAGKRLQRRVYGKATGKLARRLFR